MQFASVLRDFACLVLCRPGAHKACQTEQLVPEDGASGGRPKEASRPRKEATTAISELDQVFFAEEQWESLALDLGYRLLEAGKAWEGVQGEEA